MACFGSPVQTLDSAATGLRRLEDVVAQLHGTAVVVAEECVPQRAVVPSRAQFLDGRKIPGALRHLGPVHAEEASVHPVARQRHLAGDLLHLRNLGLMVRKDQVDGAAVEVILGAEELLSDGRVLDVPSRAAWPEIGVPRWLSRLGPLPQREVAGVALVVVVINARDRVLRGYSHTPGKLAVVRK